MKRAHHMASTLAMPWVNNPAPGGTPRKFGTFSAANVPTPLAEVDAMIQARFTWSTRLRSATFGCFRLSASAASWAILRIRVCPEKSHAQSGFSGCPAAAADAEMSWICPCQVGELGLQSPGFPTAIDARSRPRSAVEPATAQPAPASTTGTTVDPAHGPNRTVPSPAAAAAPPSASTAPPARSGRMP